MSDKTVSHGQFEAAMNEISLLRDKLDSKSCALIILSQELLECKSQRDQFKLMGEQLRERYAQIKRKMEGLGPTLSGVYDYDYPEVSARNIANEPLAQLLISLKEQNKHLIGEIDDLRMKLEDAEGDLKVVRGQMRAMSQHIDSATGYDSRDRSVDLNLVEEMEFFKNKVILLERDLQSVLDEKEELILSRDSYKIKVDRLNEKLNEILRGTESSDTALCMDIDSLCMENRFLKERIKSLEEEKQMSNQRLLKYKEIIEKKRIPSASSTDSPTNKSKGFFASPKEFGSPSSAPNIISQRQVEQLIASDALSQMEVSPSTVAHLRSLVIALFESLQDKSMGLAHAKKTNKMLGKRIEELERQMKNLRSKEKIQIIKTSSMESSSSSATNTTTNAEDLTTPDDVDDERDVDDGDDEPLPPELNRIVQEAIKEMREMKENAPLNENINVKPNN